MPDSMHLSELASLAARAAVAAADALRRDPEPPAEAHPHNYRSVNTRNKIGMRFPWLVGDKRNTHYAGLWVGSLFGWTLTSGKRVYWICIQRA